MMYLQPLSGSMVGFPREHFGVFINPRMGTVPIGVRDDRRPWALDNGAFNDRFDEKVFLRMLSKLVPYRERCLFVTVPDVLANSAETSRLWGIWAPRLHEWPLAFVAQDGQEDLQLPDAPWVFIGGSTGWKLGKGARDVIRQALERGSRVHVGRVNSERRLRYFHALGAHTADGTFVIFGRRTNDPRIRAWMERLSSQPSLPC